MPRFHFNIHDGIDVFDPTGTELADWQAARIEAVRLAGVIFQGNAPRIALGEDWHMNVTDDFGLLLFRLDFSSIEGPAVGGEHSKRSKLS